MDTISPMNCCKKGINLERTLIWLAGRILNKSHSVSASMPKCLESKNVMEWRKVLHATHESSKDAQNKLMPLNHLMLEDHGILHTTAPPHHDTHYSVRKCEGTPSSKAFMTQQWCTESFTHPYPGNNLYENHFSLLQSIQPSLYRVVVSRVGLQDIQQAAAVRRFQIAAAD